MEESGFLCVDVGSSKIVLMAVESTLNGLVREAGIYTAESSGIKNGMIVDREQFQSKLRSLVLRSGLGGDASRLPVIVTFSGPAVSFFTICSDIKLKGSATITQKDLDALLSKTSKAFAANSSTTIVHVEPIKYRVDDITGVRNPVGMYGDVLEGTFGILCTSNSAVANLISAISTSGLHVRTIIPAAAASGFFCSKLLELGAEDKVCILDMGGQTTNMSMLHGDRIVWAGYAPIGGDHITSDLAVAVGIEVHEAKELKHGLTDAICSQTLPGSNVKKPLYLGDVVKYRVEEIVNYAINQGAEHNSGPKPPISHKIVLCGGGAMLHRISEMISVGCGIPCCVAHAYTGDQAHELLNLAVRDPSLSAAVGGALIISSKATEGVKTYSQ